ncbi:MAG: DoxX family protein [Flammeovirgaceae bacterium]|nr:DoxX family protein [Flammeovirgaceae bacterium]
MYEHIEIYLDSKKHLGIFLLRIFVSIRLLYGVLDNIISWERMIEFSDFLQNYGFPFPLVNAIISVYAQFFCAILILVGYKIRFASFVLVINFLVALIFVHISAGDTIEGMTGALAMLFGSLTFLFTGSDKISIDHRFKS